MRTTFGILVLVASVLCAAAARADEPTTARDIQAAVDDYAASVERDANLVGGPGAAGYDAGFWIRGGDFSLRINVTIQARWEAFDWDERDSEAEPGGDLSGFSLPRATVKLSGTAPCDTRYYMELEFGHPGEVGRDDKGGEGVLGPSFFSQSFNFANTREAWIEWGASPALNVRMGQIKIPAARQLMTPPELQQFVDISALSSWTGWLLPGYTDRNRDHGIMLHGAFGCENEFSWMFAVTNGDSGDSIRNVHDGRTDDNLSLSGRVNWAFLRPIGYEEGALRQTTCEWYGEVGAWAYYHADRIDNPHTEVADYLRLGADVALGTGGFSFTGAFLWWENDSEIGGGFIDGDGWGWMVQAGYLFPDTAWEIAARFDMADYAISTIDGSSWEASGAVNYYLNGHGNKLTVDVTYIDGDDAFVFEDAYAGYNFVPPGETALMIRFQWQLAL